MKKSLIALMMVTGLSITACGGGGGSSGGNDSQITGACATCDSDADCEEGLKCQACVDGCAGAAKRCAGLAGESDEALKCEGDAFPGGCVNIAGEWTLTEEVNGQCSVSGDDIPLEQSGTASVVFKQDGCNVSYTVPEINSTRSGTIVGNRMRLSGPFLVVVDDSVDVNFHENVATVEGTVFNSQMSLMGEGHASASAEGENLTCNGVSTADGFR